MRAARKWQGGEAVDSPGPKPARRYRTGTPGRGRDRLARRDAVIRHLIGLGDPPPIPLSTAQIADVFGLSLSGAKVVVARLRSEAEGRRDG